MTKDWNKEFAFYAASLYRIGNYTDATLVCVIMFEKAIYTLLEKKGIDKDYLKDNLPPKTGELKFAINELCQEYSEYDSDQLQNIRIYTRNNIVHGTIAIEKIDPNIIKTMIILTWRMLDKERYQKYGKTPEKIGFLIADYHVVGMRELFNKQLSDELAKKETFNKFVLSDFEELYLMRNKMFSLASKIEEEILQPKYEGTIKIDLISRVDTTSAYVWMPMNTYNDRGEKLTSASASILATPLDFRIYLDIGGATHQVRKDYYTYLQSNEFKKVIEENTIERLEYFDVDWYCFITEQNYIGKYNDIKIQDKINTAMAKLEEYEDKIITWNKLLVGFIMDRDDITFEDIQKRLEFILKLYSDFITFQDKQ